MFSTFTGYINRLRGYHAQKNKLSGYDQGLIESYYIVPANLVHLRDVMRRYERVGPPFWSLWYREFPVGWRDIDHDVDAQYLIEASRRR